MLKSITSRLTGLAGKAVDTVAELLSGEGVSDAIKACEDKQAGHWWRILAEVPVLTSRKRLDLMSF